MIVECDTISPRVLEGASLADEESLGLKLLGISSPNLFAPPNSVRTIQDSRPLGDVRAVRESVGVLGKLYIDWDRRVETEDLRGWDDNCGLVTVALDRDLLVSSTPTPLTSMATACV